MSAEKPKESCRKMTISEYRKTVGIKVINQKSGQKLGIVTKPKVDESTSVITVKGALCPHCGYSSSLTAKCERCGRTFPEKAKMVDLPVLIQSVNPKDVKDPQGVMETKETPTNSPSMSKESFYGSRRPRSLNPQSARQVRLKAEEPQCVTLSSDEEDSCPEAKKLKEETALVLPEQIMLPTPEAECSYPAEDSAMATCEDPLLVPSNPEELPEPKEEVPPDLVRWKSGGLKGPFFAVSVRSARIGSYKCVPVDRVLLSSEGILLKIPVMDPNGQPSTTKTVDVTVATKNMLEVQVHFSRALSAIFLRAAPSVSRNISKLIGLTKDGTSPYWDQLSEEESQKRLILMPSHVDETAKNAIKQAFGLCGVYQEISAAVANDILIKCSPRDVREIVDRLPANTSIIAAGPSLSSPNVNNSVANKENGFKMETRSTRSSTAKAVQSLVPIEIMFFWSDSMDRFSVTTEDYACLNQDQYLNDSIIDFYLRYVFSTKLSDSQKKKCHVFSSFFYQRLTTRPPRVSGRKHPIEDDATLNIAQKRHSRVKSWTKKIDIFEKEYLIIPVNVNSHWFLAIVCFAGLAGPMSMKDNRPLDIPISQQLPNAKKTVRKPFNKIPSSPGESFMIGNTTVTPVGPNGKAVKSSPITISVADTDRDEAETDEDEFVTDMGGTPEEVEPTEESEPIKQPCILFFDSLYSSRNHIRVAATLREYLMEEYRVKKVLPADNGEVATGSEWTKLFSKDVMLTACPRVPQQNNAYDCGVYVLQFAESFMKKPLPDFHLARIKLSNWFPSYMANRKRRDIQFLLIRLAREKNPMADSILKMLPSEDVRIALQSTQNREGSLSVAAAVIEGTSSDADSSTKSNGAELSVSQPSDSPMVTAEEESADRHKTTVVETDLSSQEDMTD